MMDELPSMLKTFLQLSKTAYKKQDVEEKQDKMPKVNEFAKILMAFLELVHEIMKCALTNTSAGENLSHVVFLFENVSNFLWIDNLSAVVIKKLMDVTNCVLDYFLDGMKTNQIQNINSTHVAQQIVRQITGGWLERIEYRNVPLGFGGTVVAQHVTPGDFCNGDYPLLRQLVRLWMSAAVIVLHDKIGTSELIVI